MTLSNIPLSTSDLQLNYGNQRNSTLICTPITTESIYQMLAQMQKAKEVGADIVEFRVDFLKNFSPRQNLKILIKQSSLPNLVTYRILESLLWTPLFIRGSTIYYVSEKYIKQEYWKCCQ